MLSDSNAVASWSFSLRNSDKRWAGHFSLLELLTGQTWKKINNRRTNVASMISPEQYYGEAKTMKCSLHARLLLVDCSFLFFWRSRSVGAETHSSCGQEKVLRETLAGFNAPRGFPSWIYVPSPTLRSFILPSRHYPTPSSSACIPTNSKTCDSNSDFRPPHEMVWHARGSGWISQPESSLHSMLRPAYGYAWHAFLFFFFFFIFAAH